MLLSSETSERGLGVSDFLKWFKASSLNISVEKPEEMCIDFEKWPTTISSVTINIQTVKLVAKKSHQLMHFYQKLCTFKVSPVFLKMFNSCFIESVLTFFYLLVRVWYWSRSVKNKNRLRSIVNAGSKIARTPLNENALSTTTHL
ncbi:hypothetical protein CRENBAI_014382 [Crenichthys baileyi]|uniref:Uncharacterized protein n=1 Tax=Crenichthys baileyi TaxID=28760 RepID=A0AAV9RRI6_9TELE